MIRSEADRAEALRALRDLCRNPVPASRPRLSTGIPALDGLLPEGGLERGSLVEWLVPGAGCGAAVLALQGIRPALERRPAWAVVDPTGEFYAPALAGWGIPSESLLLLRPTSIADVDWVTEQCLRCPAIGVTWVQAPAVSDRVMQRWKRAAEVGDGLGVLFRPVQTRGMPSWASVRWLVRPQPNAASRRIRVELQICRGLTGAVDLDVNDATGHVRLVSVMADPAAPASA